MKVAAPPVAEDGGHLRSVKAGTTEHPFRLFVSYSHEDRLLAEGVVKALEGMGMKPIWDKDIRPGMPFSETIKGLIAHAHIFMPIITENSQKRPWVHQETGYAMALNIPVLPIAIGNLPGEMISQLQAISVKPDLAELVSRLEEADLERVVFPAPRLRAVVEVADWPETRTELMAQCAKRVLELRTYGRVRQRGVLSSFSIPDKDVSDPIWKERYAGRSRSSYYRHLLREERRTLELHARKKGCSLIIDPSIHDELGDLEPVAIQARLSTLLDFLRSATDDQVQVAITPRARGSNLTIVGDWFVAESQAPRPGEGYRQTVFSWHAPTVLSALRRFDQEWEELAADGGRAVGGKSSREVAIEEIEQIGRKIASDFAVKG